MTQHEKIIAMCLDGEWHCQNEFRANFIFSPHKRRIEIEGRKNLDGKPTGKYLFDVERCVHGQHLQYDYRMRENLDYRPEPTKTELKAKELREKEQQILDAFRNNKAISY